MSLLRASFFSNPSLPPVAFVSNNLQSLTPKAVKQRINQSTIHMLNPTPQQPKRHAKHTLSPKSDERKNPKTPLPPPCFTVPHLHSLHRYIHTLPRPEGDVYTSGHLEAHHPSRLPTPRHRRSSVRREGISTRGSRRQQRAPARCGNSTPRRSCSE